MLVNHVNNYNLVIVSPGSPPKPDAKYKIKDVSLEYEIATQPDLARCSNGIPKHGIAA